MQKRGVMNNQVLTFSLLIIAAVILTTIHEGTTGQILSRQKQTGPYCGDGACFSPAESECTCPQDCTDVEYCGDHCAVNDGKDNDEECDGTDDSACPGQCISPGSSGECLCGGGAACDQDSDNYDSYYCGGFDCDDTNPNINPGAQEICADGLDNDCDGDIDSQDSDCSFDAYKWQLYEIVLNGPTHYEKDSSPNPFVDYELYTKFTGPSGQIYRIPGFFDGDGQGGDTGNIWKIRFSPDEEGTWTYRITFLLNGNPINHHGETGSFIVGPADQSAPDFFAWGRLEYPDDGSIYLKFRDGPHYIKGGPDSPENFLGYAGFVDTSHHGIGQILRFQNHINDWNTGDPLFDNGQTGGQYYDSKGIIGALNYLSSQDMNSIYFLPMNIGGDAKSAWPYADSYPLINPSGAASNDDLHFNLEKLHQWGVVFEHAQRKGIVLHFVLCESETMNKLELDGNYAATQAGYNLERQILYKEFVARYGWLPALLWNICEEYDGAGGDLDLGNNNMNHVWIDGLRQKDPYHHPIGLHNSALHPLPLWAEDNNFQNANLDYASVQNCCSDGTMQKGDEIEEFILYSKNNGIKPMALSFDEPRSTSGSNLNQQRKEVLWPAYLSGAMGVEWYFSGYDQSLDDFRPYQSLWDYTKYARTFLEDNFQFWLMQPKDNFVTNINDAQVYANIGQEYAVYLPNGGSPTLNLAAGSYHVKWYNPRTGQYSQGNDIISHGGGAISLGNPPFSDDVAVAVTRI